MLHVSSRNSFETSVNHYIRPFEQIWVIGLDFEEGKPIVKLVINNEE
jgi:hypothetical protein